MMDATRIIDLLARLRASDVAYSVFGSETHHYQLNPVATKQMVQEFELRHSITLPPEYRDFIMNVGNGGAGPFYGLLSLGEFDQFDVGSLAEPFPYSHHWNADDDWFDELKRLSEAEIKRADRPLKELMAEPPSEDNPTKKRMKMQSWYFDSCHINGTIPLCHEGCNYYDLLVVSGPMRGTVWIDGRTSDGGIAPVLQPDGGPYTFATWYNDWLIASVAEVRAAAS